MTERGEIRAEALMKRFGAFVAVADISFTVSPGEVVGFLGPNGAGKSTTLRMVTGVFPPTSGRCTISGHDVVRDAIAARTALGYLPERTALYTDMTVERYLRFVGEMKRIAAAALAGAVGAAMDATAVAHMAQRPIGTLSKGYRQRVGIAQALLGDPDVLILDEPTSGLDPEQAAEIRTLVRGLADARRTVLLSSHVLPEVESICSRVIILAQGRVVAVDAPARLEQRLRPHREVAVRAVGDAGALLALLRAVPGVLSVTGGPEPDGVLRYVVGFAHRTDIRREIAAAVVGGGMGLLALEPVVMTLEEIFLTLIGRPDGGEG